MIKKTLIAFAVLIPLGVNAAPVVDQQAECLKSVKAIGKQDPNITALTEALLKIRTPCEVQARFEKSRQLKTAQQILSSADRTAFQ